MSKSVWRTMVVVGAQWGDEGKGKVTDYLGKMFDYVVRFQGGNNAGHTIVHGGRELKLHLLPSGVLHRGCTTVIGNGVVIDPRVLFEELAELKRLGVTPKLAISERAHIIFPFHIRMDGASEGGMQKHNLAALSTKRGIWPTYADKAARVGIRAVDLTDRALFRKKFDLLYDLQLRKLRGLYGYRGRMKPKLAASASDRFRNERVSTDINSNGASQSDYAPGQWKLASRVP